MIKRRNKVLVKAKKILEEVFETEWLDNDALSVINDETPVAIIIHQSNVPGYALISLPLDGNELMLTSKVSILLASELPTEICEQFYISKKGILYFGNEASLNYEQENNVGYIPIIGTKTLN